MVESGAYSNQELNTLLWVRAAPWMHSAASSSVLCPFCRQPVPGWGAHLPGGCIKLVQALLHAFRPVASHMAAQGLDVRQTALLTAISPDGQGWLLRIGEAGHRAARVVLVDLVLLTPGAVGVAHPSNPENSISQ